MSQKERIIEYINKFGSITSLQAYMDLGISQLGARIDGLERDGYSFDKEWQEGKNRFGEPIKFKKYSFAKEK
jgi:hypothetical protein